jgi:hypothetical protein
MIPLTPAETRALAVWRIKHGRQWKAPLRALWERANPRTEEESILYTLRNTHGPSWLVNVKVRP